MALALERFVTNLPDAISARTHLHRESFVWWVLCPILYLIVLTCLALLVSDALGWIRPMRDELLATIKTILVSSAVSGAIAPTLQWLFGAEAKSADSESADDVKPALS